MINNQQQLLDLCSQINESSLIAVDTEFMREKTYYPLLCLIQINVNNKCFAIDSLSKELDLQPFFDILQNPDIKKIFHSLRQDVEIFNQITGKAPVGLIDTQIMANFCGFDYNISYAGLVAKLLGKELNKQHQRSDWQKRPLDHDQIEYALIDVLYLPQIHQILDGKLTENKKQWFSQEMLEISQNCNLENQNLFKNFSFNDKNNICKENIKSLIIWRDDTAKKRNIPRRFVMKDDLLIKISREIPRNMEQLNKCCAGYRFSKKRPKEQILTILHKNLRIYKKQKTENKTHNYDLTIETNLNFKLNDAQNKIYQFIYTQLISCEGNILVAGQTLNIVRIW